MFGRKAKRVLEIGFGNGEALRFAAQHDKERDLIGIEVHAPGVGRLLNALAQDGSDHVRLYHHDAVEVLRNEIADGSLDEVRIYFPDPWHKKRHNKRRLVQPEFAALLVAQARAPAGACTSPPIGRTMPSRCGTCSTPTPGLRQSRRPARHACRGRSGGRRRISRPAARNSATACGIFSTTGLHDALIERTD